MLGSLIDATWLLRCAPPGSETGSGSPGEPSGEASSTADRPGDPAGSAGDSAGEEGDEEGGEPGTERHAIERMVGGAVGDLRIYRQALTHRSVLREQPTRDLVANERLEFLGDAVLGLVVAEYLFREFPEEDEGFLTKVRSKLVNNRQALARFARRIDLGERLILSRNMARSGGRDNASILADALEAVIGAVYLDRGLDRARRFIERRIFAELDLAEVANRKQNYKSILQEVVQGRGWTHPEYRLVSEEGPSHRREFTAEVLIEGEAFGTGTGRSKKKAEQAAAAEALEQLRSS